MSRPPRGNRRLKSIQRSAWRDPETCCVEIVPASGELCTDDVAIQHCVSITGVTLLRNAAPSYPCSCDAAGDSSVVGKVLGQTVRFIREKWQTLAGAALAIGALSELIGLLSQVLYFDKLDIDPLDQAADGAARVDGGLFLWTMVSVLLGVVITAVMLNLVAEADRSGSPDINIAVSTTFARFFPLVGLMVVSGVAMTVGFILLFIPGIWIAVSLVPSMAIFFLERRGPLASFKESVRLVRGSWWSVFGIIVTVALFNLVVGTLRFAPGAVGFLLGVVVSAITVVVQAAVVYYVFVELRGESTIDDVRTT